MKTLTQEPAADPGAAPPRIRRKTLAAPKPNTVAATVVVLAMLAFGFWALSNLKINLATLTDSVDNSIDFLGRVLPLDFPPLADTLVLVAQTLAIVIAATLLSMILSIPLAFWAAGNTARNRATRLGSRAFIVVMRAIPDLVLAIVLVRIIGLGIIPGVLAMGLHSIGMIGKLYADAIEQIDEGPRTAIRATGARRLQQLVSGVLPQVMPSFVATAMHRLDINLRISVLLGFVGVAGIGKDIKNAIETLNYDRGIALAVIVLVMCVAMELISGAIRKAILGPGVRPSRGGVLWLTGSLSAKKRAARAAAKATARAAAGPVPAEAAKPGRITVPMTPRRITRLGLTVLAGLVVLASVIYVGRDLIYITSNRFFETLAKLWPPDTGGVAWSELLNQLFLTIQIAFGATIIGAVLALPVGSLAARNVAPNLFLAKLFRMFIVFVRGIPELILAIVFVIMIGLGPVAGTIALSIGAIGLLGKLVADSIEEVDPGVEQALRATGASRLQVFFSATVPQALPAFIGHLLYQLDVNIRSATLLGIVGAGGIGYYLLQASRVLEFGTVTLIMLMLFGVVMAVELIAIWLRRTAGAKG